MTEKRLRWGIIGLGSLAGNGIVPAAQRSARAVVTAGMTRDAAKGRAFVAKHGIPRLHETVEALVADPEVDAVFVATPNALHVAPVLAAAKAGKPVLCEKPLAMTLEDAETMVAACRETGVMLRLGLHLRFEKFLDRIAAVIRGGEIGRPLALTLERAAPMAERRPWRLDPAQGGNILYDVGIHLVDAAPRLLGDRLVSVAAMASPPVESGRGADTVTLLCRSAGGAQVTLRCTREVWRAPADLTVLGDKGFLRTGPLRWVDEYVLTVTTPEGTREERMAPDDLYRDELDAFALDLTDGGTRLGTGEDGIELVKFGLAAEQAMREGRTVTL